ncbi:MAG: BMP family ABC transporter substrate-binding protein [Butyrivibrio sp.]|uniref:BMP family lipoprotein n=1 Tax=Butyrivibrio sp. TaxID=28121 RepID=UPI001B79732F|nr:BMP family ABC transporter substrate-binding protein [Butyrivibrio sp.]MBP3278512.1 BMP family ABC transporter substrate-binding protein [Butyrivibrio sp.]MBP3784528.1 BMP family ABC transporter substrate-binding protein [Butyrivibrio sp.]
MKKKILAVLMAATMVSSLAACGSSAPATADTTEQTEAAPAETAEAPAAEATEATEAPAEATDMKVAMVTDYGDITDQSFNQSTYEACKAFGEANGVEFTYYKPEGDSDAERVAMIDKAVADGFNVIVMPGYAFAGAIKETAEMYPDIKFVALDVSEYDLEGDSSDFNNKTYDNVFSAVYQEELPGYMAGYAAVKMGYTKLGFLGGMAVPAVIRYGYGFVQGADAAASEIGADVEINYAYGNQFYGDSDITAAMDTWYQGGTEVVFACGGGIFTSAGEAAAKVNGKVIGVDVDQAATIDGMFGKGMTITSAQKGLQATVNTLLSAIRDGQWDSFAGQIQNLGLVSADDLSLNYVSLADSTVWTDTFTADDYKQLVSDMVSGKITVSNDSSAEEPSATTAKINFQGNIK